MTCEFLNEVVDEYLTFHQTRMPECKIPIPKRSSNMSEQMFLGNGNLFQEPYPPFLSFGDQNIVFFEQFIDMNLNNSTCVAVSMLNNSFLFKLYEFAIFRLAKFKYRGYIPYPYSYLA